MASGPPGTPTCQTCIISGVISGRSPEGHWPSLWKPEMTPEGPPMQRVVWACHCVRHPPGIGPVIPSLGITHIAAVRVAVVQVVDDRVVGVGDGDVAVCLRHAEVFVLGDG